MRARALLRLEQRIAEGARALQAFPFGRTENAEERVRPVHHAEARGMLVGPLRPRLRGGLDQVQRAGQQVAQRVVVGVGIDMVAERDEEPHAAADHRLAQLLGEGVLRSRHVEQEHHVEGVERCVGGGIGVQRLRGDASSRARRRQRRLHEEGLVAAAQRRGRAVHDQRLDVAGHLHGEVSPVVLVESLRLVAGKLHPAGDQPRGQHHAQGLAGGPARGNVDEALGHRVLPDAQRDLKAGDGFRPVVGDGRHHLVSAGAERGRGPHRRRHHRGVGKVIALRGVHEDHVGPDARRACRRSRGRRHQRRRRVEADGVRRQIAEGDDALAGDRALAQGLGCGSEARGHVAAEPGGLRRLQRGGARPGGRRRGRRFRPRALPAPRTVPPSPARRVPTDRAPPTPRRGPCRRASASPPGSAWRGMRRAPARWPAGRWPAPPGPREA